MQELQTRALKIRQQYQDLETQEYGRSWTTQEIMLGLVKDIGDLAKLVQAKSGVRNVEDVDAKLAHELVDCLWSVLVLANEYDIDLDTAFTNTMDELEERIKRGEA